MHKVLQFLPLYNPCTRCDVIAGPCACGAWHKEDEMLDKIEKRYGMEGLKIAIEIMDDLKKEDKGYRDDYEWIDVEQGLL